MDFIFYILIFVGFICIGFEFCGWIIGIFSESKVVDSEEFVIHHDDIFKR